VMLTKVRNDDDDDDDIFWRKLILPEEDRRRLFPNTWKGGYRWFRSENVVCIEHFRRSHTPGQKAGRFGWIKD
jgi:hypothetical protein